ncbi:MAG: TlpA disulfide reductase family protein [Deferrisomatales bacterium]|nr:TlpA disulfide reductase family protein [Deferrisomatales bacterium]
MRLPSVFLLSFLTLAGAAGCATVRPEGEVVPVEAPTPRETGKVEVGQPYFDFTGPLLRGGEFSLAKAVGRQVVLLQFWGIRCGPCLQEFRLLDRLYEAYRNRGLLVLGVNTDGLDAVKLTRAMAERGISPSYPVMLDREFSAAAHYTQWLVPVSVLIDRQGVVRAVHTGYKPELDPVIEAELVGILEE